MQIASSFWSTIQRALDGTPLAYAHAKKLWDDFIATFNRGLQAHFFNTGLQTAAIAAANATVLAFTVPAGKKLKVWDYGWTRREAQVTGRLRNTTDNVDVLASLGTGFLTEATGIDAPLATLDAAAGAKNFELQVSNSDGAATHVYSAYLRVTLE